MSKRNYGIESITDAFLALSEMDEEIVIPKRKSKKLDEGASVNVRDTEDVELAQNFRKNDKKEEDSNLEVIDVDADSLENLKDGKSYVGKMLLQCNSCKATRFIDIDKLVADENDKDLYNMEDECPHCHNTGTGYTLIGQVGKATQENETASLDNDEKSDEEAMFDNVDEVEGNTETENTGNEENTETENSEDDIEKEYDETAVEDDTEDLDLPELGDEFDVDDVMEDDTEDDEEEKDKSKKESLQEDYAPVDVKKFVTPLEDMDEDPDYEAIEDLETTEGCKVLGVFQNTDTDLDYWYYCDNGNAYMGTLEGPDYMAWRWSVMDADEIAKLLNDSDDDDFEDEEDFDESLDEKLDMATFEGSIANLIDTFTIEDSPVNVKVLNKNGSELGIYSSDELPFKIKSQMMDTFNTDDNYFEINVTEDQPKENGTKVKDLFTYYRPDEYNQTTLLVTDVDTEEETEYVDITDLSDFLEKYGDYYISGALGLRTLNIFITDSDLDTEVEVLDDEEIEDLGDDKEVTEESLVEEIINAHPKLKLNRINNPLAEEYFIRDSIMLGEDLDLVYNNFVKPTKNEKLIENFKSLTGYEDEVDKFLKEHNISKEKYNKIISEDYDADEDNNFASNGHCYYDSPKNASEKLKTVKDIVAEYESYYPLIRQAFQSSWGTAYEVGRPKGEKINVQNELNYPRYTFDFWEDKKPFEQQLQEFKDFLKDAIKNHLDGNGNQQNENLLTSVKSRAELGKVINKLVEANEKYRIAKSVTEGYRYDIFVSENCKLNEGLFDAEEVEVLDDDHEAEKVETELVDQTPATEVAEPVETTALVPEDMSPEDVEIVQKIDRIADDICNAINDTYGLDVSDKKNLVVADIIQDLQLIGGQKVVDDLEDTPINNLTKQMYDEFNGFWDALDDLVSFISGERITTSQAERLRSAIESLDSQNFSTENIRKGIASQRFLQAAQSGAIPYINAELLGEPVEESLDKTITEETAWDRLEKIIQRLKDKDESLNEDTEMNKDNTDFKDVESRLGELNYLKTQRELTDEEAEELAYCENEVTNKMTEDDLEGNLDSFNTQEFDDCVNEYYANDGENVVAYRTKNVKKVHGNIEIDGVFESVDSDTDVKFTLSPSNDNEYIVTNDVDDNKFNLTL